LQRLLHRKPRDLRSVGRAVGVIPRSFTYLRSDPSTLAARQPAPFAGNRKTQAALADAGVVVPVSRLAAYLGGGDIGCSSIRIEEGSTESPGARLARIPVPCPSLGAARPMLLGEAIPRAPSLHRGGRHYAHRPRLERGDAPARGTRRGSTEGMAPRRHLTAGVKPGRARPGRRRFPPSHQSGRTRTGGDIRDGRTRWRALRYRADDASHPGGTGCASSEWARPATVVLAGNRQEILRERATAREGARGPRREPRAEEDSRLAGVPARRTCVAEIGSAIAAQRSPFETPTTGFRSARRSPAPAACESRVGQQTGRRGLRSRVNLSDGIARCPPERSRRRSDCRSDHSVDVHGEHPGRKAWVGIDQALGSPSVLPKEDSPDRPLALLFTEEGQRRSWLERPEA